MTSSLLIGSKYQTMEAAAEQVQGKDGPQEAKKAWKRRVSQMTYRPKARYRRNFEPQPVPLGFTPGGIR